MNLSEFQQIQSTSSALIVIDFWAPWCKPCMITKPVLEKLAGEYAGKVEFLHINADDSREVLEQFHVLAIPTIVTLRSGKETGRITGAQNEANYRAVFEALSAGGEIKTSLTDFDRMLRLGAGALFIMVSISTHNWMAGGIGSVLFFMGMYDRCPIWKTVTGFFKKMWASSPGD
jgi:thioredoxin 1